MDFQKSTSFGERKFLTNLGKNGARVQDLILVNECFVYILFQMIKRSLVILLLIITFNLNVVAHDLVLVFFQQLKFQ